MDREFNWNSDDSVVIPTTKGIAVYVNKNGDIVIRQQASDYGEDDSVVIVPLIHLSALIDDLNDYREEFNAQNS